LNVCKEIINRDQQLKKKNYKKDNKGPGLTLALKTFLPYLRKMKKRETDTFLNS
jgi:hypothetical protein